MPDERKRVRKAMDRCAKSADVSHVTLEALRAIVAWIDTIDSDNFAHEAVTARVDKPPALPAGVPASFAKVGKILEEGRESAGGGGKKPDPV